MDKDINEDDSSNFVNISDKDDAENKNKYSMVSMMNVLFHFFLFYTRIFSYICYIK